MLHSVVNWMQRVLLPLGGWGLFPAALLDSSFLTLVGGVDLWLVSLCVSSPSHAPLYVFVTTVGSVSGTSLLYWTFRKGEETLFERNGQNNGRSARSNSGVRIDTAARIEEIRDRITQSGVWGLFVAAMMPPPTPFKLVVAAAGLLKLNFGKSVAALLAGRGIRYSGEAILAVLYGRQALDLVKKAGPWSLLGIILLVGVLILVLRRRRTPSSSTAL